MMEIYNITGDPSPGDPSPGDPSPGVAMSPLTHDCIKSGGE
jgi:hypothetical protein